jgi:5-methylcytosine-specific restriction endonuclease McrA
MKPTLLLNATYEPLTVVTWKKAITLMILGKAEAIEEHERVVRSARDTFTLPSVLRLIRRVNAPRTGIQFSRLNVYRRDGFECQYCGDEFDFDDLTFDHVVPQSRGGETDWNNIVTACGPCNRAKGDRTPEEAGMPLLNQPKRPRWWPFSESAQNFDKHPDSWRPYLWT